MSALSELLGHIRASDIASYLTTHGWSRPIPAADGYAYYVAPIPDDGGAPIRLPVPTVDGVSGFSEMATRLVAVASAIEGRTEVEVATAMSIVAIDAIDIRILPPDGGHRILLRDSSRVYGAIYDLFTSGAVAEEGPAPVVGKRGPGEGPTAAHDLFLLPAEPRSFSFRVESVIRDPDPVIAGTGDSQVPIERRSMIRIMRGLQRCREASETETGWANPDAEYVNGLNANMCESLIDLRQAIGSADVEFSATWSPKYPVAADVVNVKSVRVTNSMLERLYALVGVLRKQRLATEIVDATGVITELRDTATRRAHARQSAIQFEQGLSYDPNYSVTIKTSGKGGMPRVIHFTLSEQDYIKACHALPFKKRVRLAGRLTQRSSKWVLDPMRSFEILPARKKK